MHETYWQPGIAGQQWLAVDLGQEVRVSAHKLVGAVGEDETLAFQFQVGPVEAGPWVAVHEGKLSGEFFRVFPVDVEKERQWVRLLVQSPEGGFLLRDFGFYTGPNVGSLPLECR